MSARHLAQQPQTMIGFLKSIGGLRSCDELRHRDARKVYPGLVNDKRGLSLDKAREACAEAGYLGADNDDAMAETTVNDFLDALDSHPHYRLADSERLYDWQMMKARAGEIASAFEVEIERITGEPLPPYVLPEDDGLVPIDEPAGNERAEKAKAWRERIGLTQAKLAEASGYSLRSVRNFEDGAQSGYSGGLSAKGKDRLIPPESWRKYALACAAVEAKLTLPF